MKKLAINCAKKMDSQKEDIVNIMGLLKLAIVQSSHIESG